jgi:glycosyltransferase involved in cell wall biosynthesis
VGRLTVLMLDPSGSVPFVVHPCSNSLAELGCEVDVYTGANWERSIGDLQPRLYRLHVVFYRRTQFRAYQAASRLARAFWQVARFLGHVQTMLRILPRARASDVVHVQFCSVPAVDWLWLHFVSARATVVYSVHDPMPLRRHWKWVARAARRLLYRGAHLLIAHSAHSAQTLQREFGIEPERIVTLPLGSLEHLRGLVPSGAERPATPIVLFLGQISARKGLETLLRAAARLRDSGVDFRLRVVGFPRMDMEPCHQLVEALGIADRVEMHLGWFPEREIARHLHEAWVVALPYRTINQSAVATAACTMGRAVVATDVGGLGEVIRAAENGLVVPPEDHVALADGLRQILTAPELRRRYERNALHYAETELSWHTIGREMLAAYRAARG